MKTLPIIWLLSLLLLISISRKSYGQSENLRFEHLSEQQGLSQNSVWSIHQDREGFMWFGTQDGLNKYDGYTFTVLKPDPHDPEHTLHHNIISDIHEDRKGRLWVTTLGGGLHQVDKRTGSVTRYGIKPTHSVLWNGLASIYEDQQGFLWICGFGGVASFDPETRQFTLFPVPAEIVWLTSVTEDAAGRFWAGGSGGIYQLDRSTGKFIPIELDTSLARQPECWSLYLDKEGILWAGTEGEGLFRMDTRRSSLSFTRYNPGGLVSKNFRFNSIYEDNRGYLWLSGSVGLQRIDKQTNQVLNFQSNLFQSGSLSYHNVSTVYQDRTGTLWIGTNNGINKVMAHARNFDSYQIIPALPSAILHQNNIGTLLEDHTGKIWLGSAGASLNGNFENGLYQFDPKTRAIKHFPAKPSDPDSLSSNWVWSLYEDQKNRLWVGTEEALHLFDRETGKFSRYPSDIPVEQIDEDAFGKLWIGGRSTYTTGSGGIASFDPDERSFTYYIYDPKDTTGLKDGDVYDIMVNHSGDIWVALSGGGIARLNQQTKQFTSYFPSTTALGHLNDKDVRALYEDAKGVVWAGTNLGGLHRFDTSTNTFTYYTMQDGLPSNHIESITGDAKGNLWLGTNKGISRFNPETITFRNFDISDGFPANEFRVGSVYSRHGKLMFGSVNGFVVFYPDSIKDNTTVPPVYITGFKVMEKSRTLPANKIELSYNENFLSFEYVALNYDAPEKNQYAYKLEGVDKDWVYAGTRRFASYTDLDPGNYTFRVKGSNNDEVWNEQGDFIQITILPPFWQTWWAYGLYGLVGVCILYGLRQYTVNQERLKNDLKIKQLEARKLQELDHLRTRFFANISHEFRTPLTLIVSPLEKLLATEKEPDKYNLYQMMRRNANRLLNLISQLLDLSKLEAHSLKLEVKPGNVIEFLQTLAASFTLLAESRHINFSTQFPSSHCTVFFDADKLEKIVVNLLSNAFKFTPDGGSVFLQVSITERERNGENRMLEIVVKDTGIGITEGEQEKIFDHFYQADSTLTREKGGVGIGLALTKELIALHGGNIRVLSQAGNGTSFTVELPLRTVSEHYLHNPINQSSEVAITGSKEIMSSFYEVLIHPAVENSHSTEEKPVLLIVEDNQELLDYIAMQFQADYQVIKATNGKMGLQKAIETIPDLVISDVMMPIMDGIALSRQLKADERTNHIPLILLTAKAGEASKLEGLETGADDYLTKPFNGTELQTRIKNLIEGRKRLRERFGREITLQPGEITITSADEKFLQRVIAIVTDHLDETDFTLESFEEAVGLSHVQFYRKLKALTNQAPGEFLRNYRLQQAAILLKGQHGNVSEVAYTVGFNSLAYFTRCFKAFYGQNPSEYLATHSRNKQPFIS